MDLAGLECGIGGFLSYCTAPGMEAIAAVRSARNLVQDGLIPTYVCTDGDVKSVKCINEAKVVDNFGKAIPTVENLWDIYQKTSIKLFWNGEIEVGIRA